MSHIVYISKQSTYTVKNHVYGRQGDFDADKYYFVNKINEFVENIEIDVFYSKSAANDSF